MSEIHSCSYYCTRPACVLAQRDELRDRLEQQAEPAAEPEHWVVTTKVGDIVGFRAPGLKKGDKVYPRPRPQQQAEPVWELGVAGRLSAEATTLASREGRSEPEPDHSTKNSGHHAAGDRRTQFT